MLAPGVIVESGAEIRDSILLHETIVRSGARIDRAILDVRTKVGEGAVIGSRDGELTLVGQGVKIPGRARLEPGARLEPEE